jgi:hypothetical protein
VQRCILNENVVIKAAGYHQCTPLDGHELQELTYATGFWYGTATKSPRLPAVLKYSHRLTESFLGCIDYLNFDPNHDQNQWKMGKSSDDDVGDDIGVYYCNGDGRLLKHFCPMLSDLDGTLEDKEEGRRYIQPFRSHVAA